MAGFIVGFDGDRAESFEAQRELLCDAPLPLAMTGLLTALPGTALWRRLEREGRLRDHSDGDAFARPNFCPDDAGTPARRRLREILAEGSTHRSRTSAGVLRRSIGAVRPCTRGPSHRGRADRAANRLAARRSRQASVPLLAVDRSRRAAWRARGARRDCLRRPWLRASDPLHRGRRPSAARRQMRSISWLWRTADEPTMTYVSLPLLLRRSPRSAASKKELVPP